MKKIGLDLPGSTELSDQEKKDFMGGSWLTPVFWSIAASLVSNFGDFREGLMDGYNHTPPRY